MGGINIIRKKIYIIFFKNINMYSIYQNLDFFAQPYCIHLKNLKAIKENRIHFGFLMSPHSQHALPFNLSLSAA